MGFFNRKEQVQQTPIDAPERPVADVVNYSPPTMEGEVPVEKVDVKEEEYEQYEDDEEIEPPTPLPPQTTAIKKLSDEDAKKALGEKYFNAEIMEDRVEANKPEDNSKEEEKEEEDEELKLQRQIEETEEKIRLVRERKEEILRKKELEEQGDEVQQPAYVPVFLSESEYLREIMKKVSNVELLLQQVIGGRDNE